MLQKLYVKNFAIIQELSIDFSNGLSAITGETGAGKSILLGAIQLLLGSRADTQVLLDKSQKCVVEAYFKLTDALALKHFFEANDIEYSEELIVRREISDSGRSRAFINDTPATLAQLNALGDYLIDLHRQFDTLSLKNKSFKYEVIDTLAEQMIVLLDYSKKYTEWRNLQTDLEEMEHNRNAMLQERDYNLFQFNELKALDIKSNELEVIEKDLSVLSHAEQIKKSLQEANFILQDAEEPVLAQLKKVVLLLNQYADKLDALQPLAKRLSDVLIETKDIQNEIEQVADAVHFDEEKLNHLLERYNEGQRLLKKHAKASSDELLVLMADLDTKLQLTDHFEENISRLREEISLKYQALLEQANAISLHRKKAAQLFEKNMNKLLPLVGLQNAKLKVSFNAIPISPNGIDEIEFLIDMNKSTQFQPIAKVASGGELSRVMLCIKSLIAELTHLPTLIFDEIDTGISGEAARQVAGILRSLANRHQIICVTHLPQIASASQHHFYIYKTANEKGQLQTQLKVLDQQQRIQQIAEMLGGQNPSPQVLHVAEEMLGK